MQVTRGAFGLVVSNSRAASFLTPLHPINSSIPSLAFLFFCFTCSRALGFFIRHQFSLDRLLLSGIIRRYSLSTVSFAIPIVVNLVFSRRMCR